MLLKYYLKLSKDDQEELLLIAQMKYERTKKIEKSLPSGSNNTAPDIA